MKEPVSLDLFPSGSFDFRLLLFWYLRRRREYFILGFYELACRSDFAIADVLDRLGGLGGVW